MAQKNQHHPDRRRQSDGHTWRRDEAAALQLGAGRGADVERRIERGVASLDLERIRHQYWGQGEFVVLPGFLDSDDIALLLGEVAAMPEQVIRKYVPGYKDSGRVSYHALLGAAPAIIATYDSRALRGLAERICGSALLPSPDVDAHACALYVYTRAGDHVGWHYDTSHYKGRRYTVLLGLENRSSAVLHVRLHTRDPEREPVEARIATEPGMLIFFNGDKVHHRLTPLGPDERRVVFTMRYLTTHEISGPRRFLNSLKDAMTYFGFRQWLFRKPP